MDPATEPHLEPTVVPSEESGHTYKFNVKVSVYYFLPKRELTRHQMHCGGCSGAVTRALQKAKDTGGARSHYVLFPPCSYFITGVSSFDVSLEKQEVIVQSPLAYDDILEKIKKTGKDVCFMFCYLDLYPKLLDDRFSQALQSSSSVQCCFTRLLSTGFFNCNSIALIRYRVTSATLKM